MIVITDEVATGPAAAESSKREPIVLCSEEELERGAVVVTAHLINGGWVETERRPGRLWVEPEL